MIQRRGIQSDKRIRVVVGHYGSGKTEFSVNYAFQLAALGEPTALVDLDIVNPYFRSREKAEEMENAGIQVISGARGHKANLDIPMISASALGPLQNKSQQVLLDVGGDSVGARVLAHYRQYFTVDECDMFFVLNAYREETADIMGAYSYLRNIEDTVGFKATGIISNTHLLRDTTTEDVMKGVALSVELAKVAGIPLRYITAIEPALAKVTAKEIEEQFQLKDVILFPVQMYMRSEWM